MIDSNLFATQITQTGINKGGLNGNVLGGNALFGIQSGGVDFLNALLGTADLSEGNIQSQTSANGNTENTSLKTKDADLALIKLALLGQDPDKSLEEKLGELKLEKLANAKENRVAQLEKLIAHLTSGLPSQSLEGGTIEQLVDRLEKRLGKLEASLDSLRSGEFNQTDEPLKALIATGLNPLQLTKITDRIQEVETKLGRKLTVEDLIAGVGNIIPAPGDEDHEFAMTDALAILMEQSQKNSEQKAEAEMAALEKEIKNRLADNDNVGAVSNALQNTQNNSPAVLAALKSIQADQIAQDGALNAEEMSLSLATKDIAERLTNGEFKELFGVNKKAGLNLAQVNNANPTTLNNTPGAVQNFESLLTFNFAEALSTTSMTDPAGYDIQTGAPFNAPMQAAAMVSANATAGQTHPGTQMVSAQISRAAQNGETKQITLQLDPPELGRVEVRLEFGDERMVKAHLIVEKPETLLMLQRDANALERALQNAGLETDSGSLDFEMASEDYAFNGDREGNSQNGGTGSGNENEAEDLDLIETTMDWDVDPETGHVHYSILA